MLTALVSLKRYGTADEFANLTAFLASDEASYITGTTFDVDGGSRSECNCPSCVSGRLGR